MMTRPRPYWRLVLIFVSLPLTFLAAPSAADENKYPILLDGAVQSQRIGLAIDWPWSGMKPFRYRCFYYGDGGNSVSFSDAFFDRYRRKGFTADTLCLGLQASYSYDPETGRHLPTYIAGGIHAKYPLSLVVPECFKNGDPLRDCDLRYNIDTGIALTLQQISDLRELDRRIGDMIDFAQTNLNYCGRASTCLSENVEDGSRHLQLNRFWEYLPEAVEKAGGPALKLDDVYGLIRSTGYYPVAVYVDSRLSRGYAILLNADGSAGEVPSAAEVAAELNGIKMASQLNADALAKLLDQ